VAFLPDSYVEVNGVARMSRALHAFARRHGYPFLCIHAGRVLRVALAPEGGELELPRSRIAIPLEPDLRCDLLVWRHTHRVLRVLRDFQPDLIHITGPNDVGQLGAWAAWHLGVPLIASWVGARSSSRES
jgi:hypothetical protein